MKLIGKAYRTVVRPAIIYDQETVAMERRVMKRKWKWQKREG